MPQQPAAEPPLYLPPQLTPEHWQRARRAMLAKMLGEFAYEELITPVAEEDGRHRLALPGAVTYRFAARRGAYGSWQVDPASLHCSHDADLDPLRFLQYARHELGLSGDTTGHLVRELTATLLADAHQFATAPTAAELADLGHTDLEGRQGGHPWIVPNKGRLGFSALDAARWAPEARTPRPLPWIAVHKRLATYRGVPGLERPELLYRTELDDPGALRALLGDAAEDYLLLPVHPWQWDETVVPLFAPWIASGEIVPLPSDGDLRLPQQSIRSFFNVTRPDRCTVKLPLAILNTLVWRGLPTERTLVAPAVTSWIHSLRDGDAFLRDECRVILLGEIASVTVDHPVYRELPETPYQYKELLGAIWRQPLGPFLDRGERARTLAALLQTGSDGRALAAELIARSGLSPQEWVSRLFGAMLPRCCTSSTATAPSSRRTARTPSWSSTPPTSRCGSRSRTSSTTSTSATRTCPSCAACPPRSAASCCATRRTSSASSCTPASSSASTATSRRCSTSRPTPGCTCPRPSSGPCCAPRSSATRPGFPS